MSLLPPNASALERAIEAAVTRAGSIETPIDTLFHPATIEAAWLPWLAWGLSVDTWDAGWTEQVKRASVADSIALHRIKGTRKSVEMVLERFDQLAQIVEWHEAQPPAIPHTFEIRLPLAGDGIAPGGRRATAAFALAIVREITRTKPLREHFVLVQTLLARGGLGVQAVGRPAVASRMPLLLAENTSLPWAALLQTEDGEPIATEAGHLMDTTP